MGSAALQGRLWGSRPDDFAAFVEQLTLPLTGAVLDAARISPGSRLLDAGCGAGLLALLARFRGAEITALDASPQLLVIARDRLGPEGVHEGDLEALPFDDASFDAVTAVNSIFYASDIARAARELWRVVRPGGRVVITAWGPPERCQLLKALIDKIAPLMPPPPPGTSAGHPKTLAAPGALAGVLERAGLRLIDEGEIACPFVFPSAEISWRANASAGPNRVAIAHSGEPAVRAAFVDIDRDHTRPDGTVRYDNVFLWSAAERPQE